ncbi:Uncharacterised protein [Mycobacteroides abscessus subsp. abscessus]|nr:Uncharacterised protein [Mycobacteroides abscessus subsp. abscessus]
MRGDQHGLAGSEVGRDGLLEVRHEPLDDVGEALGQRRVDAGVPRVAVLAVGAALLDRGRRGVVAAAPRHELVLAVLGQGLGLVEALQRTVVPLVEPPIAVHGNPVPVGGVQRQIGGGDRPAQQRRVEHVRQHTLLDQQLPAANGFGPALVSEVDVDPTGEQVLLVPLALAVTQQDQGRHRLIFSRADFWGGAAPGCPSRLTLWIVFGPTSHHFVNLGDSRPKAGLTTRVPAAPDGHRALSRRRCLP